MGMLPKIDDVVRIVRGSQLGTEGFVTDEGMREGRIHFEVRINGAKLWLPEEVLEVLPPPRRSWNEK